MNVWKAISQISEQITNPANTYFEHWSEHKLLQKIFIFGDLETSLFNILSILN